MITITTINKNIYYTKWLKFECKPLQTNCCFIDSIDNKKKKFDVKVVVNIEYYDISRNN